MPLPPVQNTSESAARPASRRRIWAAVLALAAALALAGLWILAASTLSLSVAAARSDIEARLGELTGHPVSVDGEAGFSLFPQAMLTLSDVRIGSEAPGSAFLLDIDRISADLGLMDALVGRTEIDRLTLLRPELRIGEGGGIAAAWDAGRPPAAVPDWPDAVSTPLPPATFERASALLETFFRRVEGISALEIRDGLLREERDRFAISNANLVFVWPDRDEAADLAGSFVWNGQPTEVALTLEQPLAFLDGQTNALSWRIDSPSLESSFAGQGTAAPALQLDGDLRLATPSLSRTLRWLGSSGTSVPNFGAFSLETRLHLVRSKIDLEAARLGVDGHVGQGAMEATLGLGGARTVIAGTLAFDSLNFDGLTRAVAPLPRRALDVQRPIRVDFVDDLDLDIRISAAEAGLGPLQLGELAATIKFAGGVATLDLGDSAFLAGRAEARLTVDATGPVPVAQARARLSGVDAAGLAELLRIEGMALTGRTDLQATLTTPVTNWADIIRRSRSDVTLRIAEGSVAGIDPDEVLALGMRRLAAAASSEPMPFDSLEAEIQTSGTRAAMDMIRITSGAGTFEASGLFSMIDDTIDLAGRFAPLAADPPREDVPFTASKPVGLTMQGEWPNPIVTVVAGMEPI